MEQHENAHIPQEEVVVNEPVIIHEENNEPHEPLRRSVRERRFAISDYYVVYSIENEFYISIDE